MTQRISFAFFAVLFGGALLIHPPVPAGEKQPMPFEGHFGMNSHPMTGNFLYFEGVFSQPVMNLTVIAENPGMGQKTKLAQGVNVPAGQTVTISPFTAQWIWMPGEKLTLKAPGLKPCVVTIPKQDSPEWQPFIAEAQAYTRRQAAAMGLNQTPTPDMNAPMRQQQSNPWPAMPVPQQQWQQWQQQQQQRQWQQQSPGWGGSTAKQTCSHCNGKGTVERRQSAPYYGGDDSESRWYTLDVPCPLCGGTGER